MLIAQLYAFGKDCRSTFDLQRDKVTWLTRDASWHGNDCRVAAIPDVDPEYFRPLTQNVAQYKDSLYLVKYVSAVEKNSAPTKFWMYTKIISRTAMPIITAHHCANHFAVDFRHQEQTDVMVHLFYAVMAVIAFIITWFLSYDKKSIRFLSAFLVGVTWPISFPVALLFSLF